MLAFSLGGVKHCYSLRKNLHNMDLYVFGAWLCTPMPNLASPIIYVNFEVLAQSVLSISDCGVLFPSWVIQSTILV